MWRRLAIFASMVVLIGYSSSRAVAQLYTYDFDGHSDADPQPVDPTDWMTPENWSDGGFDPGPPFGPALPDFTTRVEITDGSGSGSTGYGANAPVIGPGDVAQVYGLRIGRANGPGTLTMTGGTLDTRDTCTMSPFTCDARIRVGNADVADPAERFDGYFNLSDGTVTTDTFWIGSGSHGEMTMTGGTVNTRGDFYFDWTSDLTYNTSSVLSMSDGLIHVGSHFAVAGALRMYRLSSMNLSGGQILVDGAAELGTDNSLNPMFTQTPDVTVHITDGILESKKFLRIGGSITLDGGILRADSFNETDSIGTVEINGSGLLQFNNSMESVSAVEALITSGFFTTSEASPLVVQVVDVGGVDFTQVSVNAIMTLMGDYNENDVIDAADYTVWRDTVTAGGTVLANDPTPGTVDESDFVYWRDHFGDVLGSGAGAQSASVVPEPASFVFGLMALAVAVLLRRPAR